MTYHSSLKHGRHKQAQSLRDAKASLAAGERGTIHPRIAKALDDKRPKMTPTQYRDWLLATPCLPAPPPPPTPEAASEGTPPDAPREIVPLSKVAPPEPQAGEAAAQEEARESDDEAKPKRRHMKPKPFDITNIDDGFRIATKEQQGAARALLRTVNFMDYNTAFWEKQPGAHVWPVIKNLMTVDAFAVGVMADAKLDRLDDDQQRGVLAHALEMKQQIELLIVKIKQEVDKQEAKTS